MKWIIALIALPLGAHVMSISNGEATVNGNRVDYLLRIPFYEVEPIDHPESALLAHVSFSGGNMQEHQCFRDGDSYVCAAEYLFNAPVEKLDVTCSLYEVVVRNHVHILHATLNGKEDRAFFDFTFTHAVMRFRPPSVWEIAVQRIGQGAIRGVGGTFQMLFLLTLAMAARSRRELLAVTAAYLAGVLAAAMTNFYPPELFAECAAAIGIAYLAIEILFIPHGGMRWWIGAVLGFFQGIYLALFKGAETTYFFSGAILASVLIFGTAGLLAMRRLPRWTAWFPLAASLFWIVAAFRR